jgi:hypothetical protein
MSTPTTVTDLFVSPRRWPIWQGAVGVSAKIVGKWGKAARQLEVQVGGTLVYVDGNGSYLTETVYGGQVLLGQFRAVISAGSTAHTITICE